MADISSRHQRKVASNYYRKQMAELEELYQQVKKASPPPAPAPKVSADKPGVVSQVVKGSWHGVKKAVHEMFDSLDDLSTFVARIPEPDAPERHNFSDLLTAVTGIDKEKLKAEERGAGTAYDVASGISQFVTAFVPVNRAAGALAKGAKAAKIAATGAELGKAAKVGATIAQGAAAGGVSSAIGFDPYEARLSNLVQQVPALQNPITEYLQASPDDTKAVARMKNGVENALLGIGFDLGIEGAKGLFGALKTYKAAKTLKAAGKPGEEALAAAQEVLARESKNIRDLKGKYKLSESQAGDVIPESKPDRFDGRVVDPDAPDPKPAPTEASTEVKPREAPVVENPEVLPAASPALTEDEIMARLTNASKEGRIAALSKLEPERPIEDITKEVDEQLAAVQAAKADGKGIEIIPEISGERVPVSQITPEGPLQTFPDDPHLQVPDIARAVSDQLPQGTLDVPQLLPRYNVQGIPEEFQSKTLDASGKPFDIRNLPPIDEGVLPKKLQEIAGADRQSVTGLFNSIGELVRNQRGATSSDALAPMASASAGGVSGLFVDYNGDGKVAGWEDIGLGLLVGTGGYLAGKTLRRYLHGTPEEVAAAREEIQTGFQKEMADLKSTESAYEEVLKGSLSTEQRQHIENSLNIVRSAREALEKYGTNPAELDKVLNKAWVREKYKPIVKIPEGKSEAIVQALKDGKLDEVSTVIGKDFNFAGIQAPEDLKEALDGLTNLISEHIPEETRKMTRGVVSWDATIEGANELGVNLHNVNMLSRDTRKLAERLLAARVAMNSIKTPLIEAMDQILVSQDPPAELLMKFRELTSLAAAIQAEVKGSQTEVARALNSMKIAADTVRMDFDSVNRMLEQQGGKRQMVAAVQKLKEIMREGDQVKVNRYLRGLAGSPTLRFLNELHRAVLLSNPITHAANIGGNFLTALVNVGEATLTGVFSGRGFGDAKAILEALAQADTWGDALRFAKRAWTTSQSTIDPLISKVDGTELAHGISYDTFKQMPVGQAADYLATALGMDGALGRGIDASGRFLRSTFDALGAEDEFFKVLNYRSALHREAYIEAYRIATSEGLEGAALARRIGTLKAELVETPSEQLFEKALQTTRVNTFTANPKGILGSFSNVVAKHPSLQLFIPFTRTPTNLIHYVFDRAPLLSMFQKETREILQHGTREQKTELAARWATGASLMGSAYMLASAGIITGGGDREQMSKRISGWQPYSVKVGDKYYSYNRLDPVSSFLGLAADTYDIITHAMDEQDADKASMAALIAVTRNLTSKTMLKGFTELLDAISQGDKKMATFAENFTLSWVPAGVGAVERQLDPTVRDAIDFIDRVKAKIPGLSYTLPPKRDIFGEPIVPEGNLGPDLLSPIAVSEASKDPVRKLFADLGIDTKSDLKEMQQIDRIPLTPEQHSRFVEIRGKRLKELLDTLVSNPQFERIHEDKDLQGSKQEVIQKLLSRTKAAARGQMYREFPELLEAKRLRQREKQEELRQAIQ